MFEAIKAAWARLAAGRGAGEEPVMPAVDYKGYQIRPAPYRTEGRYQTAGVIQKQVGDGVKEHRFIRAETHESRDDAAAFSIAKGKQIIDERGDAVFG